MSQHSITVESGNSVLLPTAGKYCDRDIIVTGGDPLTQEKNVEITENGIVQIAPDDGYALSKVTANVNVASSGGDKVDDLISNKLTKLESNVTYIRPYACRNLTSVKTVNLPKVTSIATNAFYSCSAMTSFKAPLVTSIADNAFNTCSALPSIVLPSLTSGGTYMFRYCYKLLTIDLPVITNIVSSMFYDCRRLTAVILRSPTMCTLANTSAFTNCDHFHGTKNSTYNPNGLKDGYIYVPRTLADGSDGVETYQAATNWSAFQFRAIEDYPEITGG